MYKYIYIIKNNISILTIKNSNNLIQTYPLSTKVRV